MYAVSDDTSLTLEYNIIILTRHDVNTVVFDFCRCSRSSAAAPAVRKGRTRTHDNDNYCSPRTLAKLVVHNNVRALSPRGRETGVERAVLALDVEIARENTNCSAYMITRIPRLCDKNRIINFLFFLFFFFTEISDGTRERVARTRVIATPSTLLVRERRERASRRVPGKNDFFLTVFARDAAGSVTPCPRPRRFSRKRLRRLYGYV